MPTIRVNNVTLYYELQGEHSSPLIFVHGGWGDHHNWDHVTGAFARSHRVVTYDRRGHSQSERPARPDTFQDDVNDLAGLIEGLALAPAHVIGSSGGGAIALGLGLSRPALCRTLVLGEPQVFSVLRDDTEGLRELERGKAALDQVLAYIDHGEYEAGASHFVEINAFSPGGWAALPPGMRQTFLFNAPTFPAEIRGLWSLQVDAEALHSLRVPNLLVTGEQSARYNHRIVAQLAELLPDAQVARFPTAGHIPHVTHPEEYVRVVGEFIAAHDR
jgi:pimeloyl-ACP methyl ester carboxylesterase